MNTIILFLSLISLLLLPLYSEISVILFIFLGGIFYKNASFEKRLKSIFLIFLTHRVLSLLINSSNFYAFLEIPLFVFAFIGIKIIREKLFFTKSKSLKYVIPTGILIHIVFSVLIWFNLVQNNVWESDLKLVKTNFVANSLRIEAITSDSWIVQSLGVQGSGRFEYRVDVRADVPFQIPLWLQATSLSLSPLKSLCEVKVYWTTCIREFTLPKREWVGAVFGTYATFSKSSPILEVKGGTIQALISPTWYEVLFHSGRVKSWAFNENAFGAWMAVVGVLALVFVGFWQGLFFVSWLPLLPILWSGSRNALLAYGFSVLLLLASKFPIPVSQWRRLSLVFTIVSGITIILFGLFFIQYSSKETPLLSNSSSSILRSTNISYDSSGRSRVQIWRLIVQAWLESPKTVLFGTGNLQQTLQVTLDSEAISNGVNKGNITHAHNLWIQTLGETGLLGFTLLLFVWILAIKYAWGKQDWGSLAIFLCIFLLNLFDYLFYYAPVQMCFWLAVIGFKSKNILKT